MNHSHHPLPADEQALIESLLRERACQIDARPEFKHELLARYMRRMAERDVPVSLLRSFFLVPRHLAIACLLLILLGTSGLTTYAYITPEVTRESNLYSLKRMAESVELSVARDPESRARVYMKFADRRLAEAAYLSTVSVIDDATVGDLTQNLHAAVDAAENVQDPLVHETLQTDLHELTRAQSAQLTQMIQTIEGPAPLPPAGPPVPQAQNDAGSLDAEPAPVSTLVKAFDDLQQIVAQTSPEPQVTQPVPQPPVPKPVPAAAPEGHLPIRSTFQKPSRPDTLPDLQVALSVATQGRVGSDTSFTVVVRNTGVVVAAASLVRVEFGDGTSETLAVPSLQPGTSVDLTVAHLYTVAKDYLPFAVANSTRSIEEVDEGNNTHRTFLSILGGDPEWQATGISSAAAVSTACADGDGGLDIFTPSVVHVGSTPYADACNGSVLQEAYCSNGVHAVQSIPCPYGCTNGACSLAP